MPASPATIGYLNQNGTYGFTTFKVTSDPDTLASGGASNIGPNYTGTYSYIIAPDNGSGTAIASPIRSFVNTTQAQPVVNGQSGTSL